MATPEIRLAVSSRNEEGLNLTAVGRKHGNEDIVWSSRELGKAEPPVPWPQGPAAATGCQPQREPDPDRVEAGKSFQLKTTLMVR